jgi:hypothetical protein
MAKKKAASGSKFLILGAIDDTKHSNQDIPKKELAAILRCASTAELEELLWEWAESLVIDEYVSRIIEFRDVDGKGHRLWMTISCELRTQEMLDGELEELLDDLQVEKDGR